MESEAAGLAPCVTSAKPAADWTDESLRGAPVVFRLPAGYRTEAEVCPGTISQGWIGPDSTNLILSLSDGASTAFGGNDTTVVTVPEGSCSIRVAGRLTAVGLYREFHPGMQDSVYIAIFDAPVQEHLWVGGYVIGLSRSERDRALVAVGTLQVRGR